MRRGSCAPKLLREALHAGVRLLCGAQVRLQRHKRVGVGRQLARSAQAPGLLFVRGERELQFASCCRGSLLRTPVLALHKRARISRVGGLVVVHRDVGGVRRRAVCCVCAGGKCWQRCASWPLPSACTLPSAWRSVVAVGSP